MTDINVRRGPVQNSLKLQQKTHIPGCW